MVTNLWKDKTTFESYKISKGYEASEPSFQPYKEVVSKWGQDLSYNNFVYKPLFFTPCKEMGGKTDKTQNI